MLGVGSYTTPSVTCHNLGMDMDMAVAKIRPTKIPERINLTYLLFSETLKNLVEPPAKRVGLFQV